MNLRWLLLLVLLCSATCWGADLPLMAVPEDHREIVVNNRILAKVNGKPITVVDVMKKLDVIFYRQFPQYAVSAQARHQFYLINWKQVLSDLIDSELIMADAKECKIEITRGEIRSDLEQQFGPQIMANLDKIGISFDEAWALMKAELLIRRMMALRVQLRAQQKASPSLVRATYEKFKESNRRPTEWIYQLITIRHPNSAKGDAAAHFLRNLLVENQIPLAEVIEKSKTFAEIDGETNITLSEDLKHNDKEISEAYRQILDPLEAGAYSEPMAQESRVNRGTVHRIFFLRERIEGGDTPFEEIQAELKGRLVSMAIQKDTEKYLTGLRQRFGIKDEQLQSMIPEGFEPFVLR